MSPSLCKLGPNVRWKSTAQYQLIISRIFVCIPLMAYHLSCQSDKIKSSYQVIRHRPYHLLCLSESLLLFIIFRQVFDQATCISFHYSINMKISMINDLHMKSPLEVFHDNQSCMTSSRRHFVFSLYLPYLRN